MPSFGDLESTGAPDSSRSVSSAGSFETLTSAGEGSLSLGMDFNGGSFLADVAGADAEKNAEVHEGLGMVETTLLDSWKVLPWQARLCPRAIEERELSRRTSALEEENLRVQDWRQKQQILATSAAREEERIVSGWWKRAAEKLWKLQSQRRESHEGLAKRHDAKLAALENQRTALLSTGYGAELATLDSMDQSRLREHLRQMETLLSFVFSDNGLEEGQRATFPKARSTASSEKPFEAISDETIASIAFATPGNVTLPPGRRASLSPSSPPLQTAPAAAVAASETNASQTPSEAREAEHLRATASFERISTQTQSELERVSLHTSAMAAMAETFHRRRQSLIGLLYGGLTEAYRDMRAGARRAFVWECAADIGRIRQIGFSSSRGGGHGSGQSSTTISSSPVSPPPPDAEKCDVSGDGTVPDVNNSKDIAISTGNRSNSSSSGGVLDPAAELKVESEPTTGRSPEAAGCRERIRATRALRSEAARVARWDKLQREVLRRSTGEVVNLLEIDSLRPAPVDGGGSVVVYAQRSFLLQGWILEDSFRAVLKRARASMRELKRRQAAVFSEARSMEQSWMAALVRWETQLSRARAAAVHGETRELRILQREDSEVRKTL
ncbi:unnamed protein product, partial [Hapterophycus canaliculatus]